MKRHFLLFSIIFTFSFLSAQETYRFRTDHPQGFSVESSTATGLSLHYSIPEIAIADIDNGEAKGQEIILKGCFGSNVEGLPNLPFENRYIAVPRGATVSIEVKEKGRQTLNNIEVLPAAAVQENSAVGLPKLRKDMNVFGKDANFPSENVVIAQSTQIRGLDVVLLNVTPFRYNPVRKTLDVIYDMDIDVHFEGGNGQFGEARYLNPDWDHLLRDLVINGDMLPEAHYYDLLNKAESKLDIGCEYLIIAPDDDSILAWADSLRRFRNRQGVLTKVVSTTECGGNEAEAIKGYIQNAYDNWVIPPAAVMIFGGADTLIVASDYYWISSGIPGFGLVFKGYDNGYIQQDFHYSSDNPYADMNGDSIPDLALSRLPALTLEEYRTQVSKLIQYETDPPTRPDYYDRPVISSSYEDNKWFLITSQSINGFCRNKLGRRPKNFYMVYDYYNFGYPEADTSWSIGYNSDVVVDYFGPNGQNYIAQQPDTLDDWRDIHDYSYLVDALNESSFLTLYRDHSSFDLWCSPWMYSSEIKHLKNTEPTFILSIGCDAALYSNKIYYETENSYFYYGESPMIGEFCKAKTGALGGIGATTVTHTNYNDMLTWGFLDNIWPNFLPDLGTTTPPTFTRPAYSLIAGKLFLNQQAFLPDWWPIKITTTHNVFHYLGETYLNLYTEVPQHMALEIPLFHPVGQLQYSFTAEEGAWVCLSKNDEILQVTFATGQSQSLTIPQMEIGEQFVVTVTKQNRFRFEQAVTIISSQEPYVYVKTYELNDQNGDGQLDYGETATIDLALHNFNRLPSEGGQAHLVCGSPYVEILQGTVSYPHIEPNAEISLHDAFQIRLSNDVPDQTKLILKVQFDEGQNTHHDKITATASAPIFYIEPEFRPMTADGEPSTHIATEGKSKITFSVANKGHSNSSLLSASLEVKAPFVEVENSQIQLESLAPNEAHPFTFELNTIPNDLTGAWLQSHFELQHLEDHVWFDTIVQYGGVFENFETDTLNPLCQWSLGNGIHRWEYCNEEAYEGQRCLVSAATTLSTSTLITRLRTPPGHNSKLSFRYKTGQGESIVYLNNSNSTELSSEEWHYEEILYNGTATNCKWTYTLTDEDAAQAKLDDFCFPPSHTTIVYAGGDIVACSQLPIVLFEAYAYDCDSLLWTTDGDGHFDNDTIANPIYTPGSQDIERGDVTLTFTAYGNNTNISTTQVRFVDEIILDAIEGDSIVNKYTNPISHYSVENQNSLRLTWSLDPANAGCIYGYGDAIDIVWDSNQGDAEVDLYVIDNNGCATQTKRINLIGYSISEWNTANFDLFPNPTDGMVKLVVGENLQGKAVLEVFNLLGERMMAMSIGHLQQGESISLDLNKMASGLYIIKLSTENGSCSKKVSVR